MLRQNNSRSDRKHAYRNGKAAFFFDDPQRFPECLGCGNCPQRKICGGLHVDSDAFDCLGYCCGEVSGCDSVCVNNINTFVRRVREIDGFGLDNVPPAPARNRPLLPRLVPMVGHGYSRERFFAPPAVGLSLYSLFDRRTGELKYDDREALCRAFRIDPETQLVLSGVERDSALERWWSLGPQRIAILEWLVKCDVVAITAPNYSLFSNAPRWDDLHAIKRIALTWQEMAAAGLNAALHVNARTFFDWRRWRDFISERPEVQSIAFEFATGAGDAVRVPWYVDQLCRMADEVRRPLTLILRGGTAMLPQLEEHYSDVCQLDYTPIQKALHRQKAIRLPNGRIKWHSMANKGARVDELLEHNYLELRDQLAQPRVLETRTDVRNPLPGAH